MSSQTSDLKSLVDNCVQYLLVADQKKLPIKKLDIVRNVCSNKSKEDIKEIIERASSLLKKVFGIKMVQVPDKNEFILINDLPINHTSIIETSVSSQCALGILLPVLALIFMSGTEIKEAAIWKFLSKLGLTPETKVPFLHTQMSIKELLTQVWVRQQYLKNTKKAIADNIESFYEWGFRAHSEIDKMQLLKWVCKVHGDDCEPKTWKKQYQEALGQ